MRRDPLTQCARALALCLCLCVLGQTPAVLSEERGSPLLIGDGPARMPVGVEAASSKGSIEGEFVLRQKYLENQYFRDEFHGWATGEGMWHGIAGSGGGGLRPAMAALTGTSNPEADFMALLEAGWLDRAQMREGLAMKRRHVRLNGYARAKVVEAQKGRDPIAIAKARTACADMDRGHYLEKKQLMENIRKVLAKRRPDLLCSGPSCGATQAGGRPRGAPSPSRQIMSPPMGPSY
jgi:hypothetical protein